MTISITRKGPPPPPHQGTFNHRLTSAGLSLAVFVASLLLTACPSPGGGTTAENNCTGTDRYSITRKSANSYKLTVKECVREIRNNEFGANGTIIRAKAAAESINRSYMITEISLPSTLTKIGERAFENNLKVRGTLTVPSNTAVIESGAFVLIGALNSGGALNLVIQSDKLAKPRPDAAPPFPLRDTLIQASGIAGITLPPRVYDSYTKAELQVIFGSTFTNYRRPNGTAYDFESKS